MEEKLESVCDDIGNAQVNVKTELEVTVSNMESKFESLHGKVNEMLVKKAEHMNERISSFFNEQTKKLEEAQRD